MPRLTSTSSKTWCRSKSRLEMSSVQGNCRPQALDQCSSRLNGRCKRRTRQPFHSRDRVPRAVAPLYDRVFFDAIHERSLRSARVVVPHLINLFHPASVLDVGCGQGAWLSAFKDLGVPRLLGVDGEHVDQSQLMIPPTCFRSVDLTRPFELPRDFDLALCLEVGEHLPGESAARVVRELTKSAPMVVFSAAIPGQGGTGHINEQWPD